MVSPAQARRFSAGPISSALIPATLVAFGFSPIGALALALVNEVPLYVSTVVLVLPATIGTLFFFLKYPRYRRQVTVGLVSGLLATLVYDCTRLPCLALGLWPDFIPKIGGLALNSAQPNWLVGYLWRYLGDGGGMGIAFAVFFGNIRRFRRIRRIGVAYGIGVWLALMTTLAACPDPGRLMFVLTPLTFAMSLLGHVVYGGVLGHFSAARLFCPLRQGRAG